ncbi:MAG TPA: helix-turn-helix domain-containing protein [Acidobacteriaceae bacterium]|nr:helix-turn-helix domain-containing protein [Acidobacteriaceae bacterium]
MAQVQTLPAPDTGKTEVWSFIMAIESHKGLLTVAELAPLLRKSCCTVYRMAERRQIPSLRIGGTLYFDPAALGMHFRRKSPESAAAARLRVA